MANNRKSYFEEKRGQYSDPNFFNRPQAIDDINKNVKRIIKDIKYGLINDSDYIYFTNPNVISACVQIAFTNWVEAATITNALNYYINVGLANGYNPIGGDKIVETNNAGIAQIKYNSMAETWRVIYQMFVAVQNGADPKFCLSAITNMANPQINDL